MTWIPTHHELKAIPIAPKQTVGTLVEQDISLVGFLLIDRASSGGRAKFVLPACLL